jgi:hypothetical protein
MTMALKLSALASEDLRVIFEELLAKSHALALGHTPASHPLLPSPSIDEWRGFGTSNRVNFFLAM